MAFDIAPDEWDRLRDLNRRRGHLRMPCCDAEVVLKTSTRGTRFFAHKRKGDCESAGETEHHLRLKRIAVEVAREAGWEALTEVAGETPSGEQWVADVLATKGKAMVAVEIQWSPQTQEETLRRQRRFDGSGVRGLWLMRRSTIHPFEQTEALPMAQIAESDDGDGYVAFLSPTFGEQTLGARELLQAAFGKRLHFRTPIGCLATVSIVLGPIDCWKCHKTTNILSHVKIDPVGTGSTRCWRVTDLEGHPPAIVRKIVEHIPKGLQVGRIKQRYSKRLKGAYLSNGCGFCDALIGRFYEHQSWDHEFVAAQFEIRIDDAWLPLCRIEGWGVYTFPTSDSEGRPIETAA